MSKCKFVKSEPVKCTNEKRLNTDHNNCYHNRSSVHSDFIPDVIFTFPPRSGETHLSKKQKLQIRIAGNDPVDREKALQSLKTMRMKKNRRKARRNAKL